jgi:hypothetical protein
LREEKSSGSNEYCSSTSGGNLLGYSGCSENKNYCPEKLSGPTDKQIGSDINSTVLSHLENIPPPGTRGDPLWGWGAP